MPAGTAAVATILVATCARVRTVTVSEYGDGSRRLETRTPQYEIGL